MGLRERASESSGNVCSGGGGGFLYTNGATSHVEDSLDGDGEEKMSGSFPGSEGIK